MAVIGTVLSVAQTLFAALQSSELKEAVSIFGYKDELKKLQSTVATIRSVFQDAEKKQTLTSVEQKLLGDLKDAVYEADDLIDEFVTLAEQKQLLKADGSIAEKMGNFFSRKNPVSVAYKMSKGVKTIRKKLDAIADDKRFSSFVHDSEPIRKRRDETCSYVNEVDIIGREQDLEKILGMLLDPNAEKDLSFLSIVGIGGLGKTALAQLIINNMRVKNAFPLRLWACVSDEQKQLDVKEVLGKVLASMNLDEGSTLDQKQIKLQQQLKDKRYLLILDDVWTEKREEWSRLVQYFVGGQSGCWVMVTTRSHITATIIGDNVCHTYELKGLSEVHSWRLFERIAFESDESNPSEDLVKLGQEIVDGCARVPLAIRVMGSLLYRQDMSKWQSIKETGFANIRKSNDDIKSILLLSYYHLPSPLKSCFSYCALFPKDFEIEKVMLISLWIAQGYIVPLCEGQSVENAGDEFFSILLKRCFFQNIEKNKLGEIVSCKMHDLMHDIAQSISGKEIYVVNTNNGNVDENVHHVGIQEFSKHFLDKSHVRSYIHVGIYERAKVENSYIGELISSCSSIRAFGLDGLKMKSLPDSISSLLHLRYLDLSYNDLEVLPKSISKLYNLQTLNLVGCHALKELPKGLSKLVKLRVLDISDCRELKYMPRVMDKLTCLQRLSDFIVGNEGSFVSWKQWFDGLLDRKAPNSLKGDLRIHIKCSNNVGNIVTEVNTGKGSILRGTEHLNGLSFFMDSERMDDEGRIALMEVLQPHSNLKKVKVFRYNGTRMPDWASYHLPNIVVLKLLDCENLEGWRRLEDGSSSGNSKAELQSQPCLPQLKSLRIYNSPQLTWVPMCPNLEILDLQRFNKRMVFEKVGPAASLTSCLDVGNSCHKFKRITIDNVAWLNSLPMEAFQCLESLKILKDEEVETLGEIKEVFRNCSSSLRYLTINECPKLRSVVSGGLEHLTALEELELYVCNDLNLSEEEEEGEDVRISNNIMPCPFLRTLTLKCLPQLHNLPTWMQFSTYLETLNIEFCLNLRAMPNWMTKFTSLKVLDVSLAPISLKKRCEKDPPGEDWPFIQHIPTITVRQISMLERMRLIQQNSIGLTQTQRRRWRWRWVNAEA